MLPVFRKLIELDQTISKVLPIVMESMQDSAPLKLEYRHPRYLFDSHQRRRVRQDFCAKMRISANAPPEGLPVSSVCGVGKGTKSPGQALTLYSEGGPRSVPGLARAPSEILAKSLGVQDFWCRPPYALRTASEMYPATGHNPTWG